MTGQFWKKIKNPMGRLNIPEYGVWGFLWDNGKLNGITILPINPEKINPDGSKSYFSIADLNDVPEGFIETAKCGKSLSGKGVWRMPEEEVTYEFYFPCA